MKRRALKVPGSRAFGQATARDGATLARAFALRLADAPVPQGFPSEGRSAGQPPSRRVFSMPGTDRRFSTPGSRAYGQATARDGATLARASALRLADALPSQVFRPIVARQRRECRQAEIARQSREPLSGVPGSRACVVPTLAVVAPSLAVGWRRSRPTDG